MKLSQKLALLAGCLVVLAAVVVSGRYTAIAAEPGTYDPVAETKALIATAKVKSGDWPQWGGSALRNNTPDATGIPTKWDITTGENIKWWVKLGSETYGNAVVANGKVYVGTNNGSGYIARYPSKVDLGCLICFDEETGQFLWQHSSEKLPTGRVHDWPYQGICSAPLVDGDRVWFVSSRGEVVCLDTEGFYDGENDGDFKDEAPKKSDLPYNEKVEADVVWKYNMMAKLSVSQHNMCSCSITGYGDLIFVCTSNGVDEGHLKVPQPNAPSFLAMNRNTGEVLWTDNTPGVNVLHGQWSSPGFAVLGGRPQVLFGGGDGWLYSFDPNGENGKAKLLWKFDCNPKTSLYKLQKATRNHIIGSPVAYDGLVYIAVGEDPEHGEGGGHLWCIDPTKSGDVSPTLVFNKSAPGKPVPTRRVQAAVEAEGDYEEPNPNSAVVWHYVGENPKKFEQTMHRTCGTVAIKNNLLLIADFSGVVHCLDPKTGKTHWTHDMLAASWASPLLVEDNIYIGDEDGDISIFKLSATKEKLVFDPSDESIELSMGNSVYSTPIVANGVLYITNKDRLFAIQAGAKSSPKFPAAGPGSADDKK